MSGAIGYGDNILSNLHKTLQAALKYGDAENVNVEQINDMAKKVCKIEHGNVLGQDMVREAAKQNSVEAFDQVLDDFRNDSSPKFKPQTSKRYMDFVKKTQQMVRIEQAEAPSTSQASTSMTVDEDLSQPTQFIPDIDPITKLPLERPVRNKICNHIYGYESVKQSLARNSRLRCPIVGCASRQYVKMTDLIEDEDLAVRLTQQRNANQ